MGEEGAEESPYPNALNKIPMASLKARKRERPVLEAGVCLTGPGR